jgi:hypothetical protein
MMTGPSMFLAILVEDRAAMVAPKPVVAAYRQAKRFQSLRQSKRCQKSQASRADQKTRQLCDISLS